MCKTDKTCYIGCKKEDLGRGPEGDLPCIDEEEVGCSEGPCSKPTVRTEWVDFKCPEHGGPNHAQRKKLIEKRKKEGKRTAIWEKKADRPNQWHGALCTMINAYASFGSCNPTIKFGTPSDGCKEDAFEAVELATFNHGSALNIGVISNFICSQVSNKCHANVAAVSLCDTAATAANGLKGRAAADAFNSAIGF